MIPAQQRWNENQTRWDATIRNYRTVAMEAGETAVQLEKRRAIVKETAKHENEKAPEWLVEALARSDGEAFGLALAHARAVAELEHMKWRLRWFQSTAEGLRSEISSERKLYTEDRSTS